MKGQPQALFKQIRVILELASLLQSTLMWEQAEEKQMESIGHTRSRLFKNVYLMQPFNALVFHIPEAAYAVPWTLFHNSTPCLTASRAQQSHLLLRPSFSIGPPGCVLSSLLLPTLRFYFFGPSSLSSSTAASPLKVPG